MPAISAQVATEFCRLCDWTYEVWTMHKAFERRAPDMGGAAANRHGYALARLGVISQEYTLLQIAKLHDPAVQQGKVNLTIAYIIEYGRWNAVTLQRLQSLKSQLDDFGQRALSIARNKVLCHNDLATLLAQHTVGEFDVGADDRYFDALREFARIVHDEVIGGPFPFCEFAEPDVVALLTALRRASNRSSV